MRTRRKGLLVAALLALVLLPGCAINGDPSTFEELGEDANTRGFGREFPQDPNEDALVMGVGDSLQIAVPAAENLTGLQTIRPDGRITLPVVGEVVVAGLTPDQIRKKLVTLLAVFMHEPDVTVAVASIVSKRIFVGAANPVSGGVLFTAVPYTGDTTVFDVWVGMGSPSSFLDDEKHLKLIRGDLRKPTIYTINMKEMVSLGRFGANVQVRPDDIIFVPPTLFGRINSFFAGVSVPFENIFRITRTITEVDNSIRVLQGEGGFRRGSGF